MIGLARTRLGSASGLLIALLLVQTPALAEQHARPLPTKPAKPAHPQPSKPAQPSDPRDGKVRLEPDGPPALIHTHGHSSSPSRSHGSGGGTAWSTGSESSMGWGKRTPLRLYVGLGGHLAIADSNLSSVMQDFGGGIDGTFLVGGRGFPLLFGAQLGADSYGGVSRNFVMDGEARDFHLTRTSVWTHGVVRLQPEWKLRPHVDLLAGVWLLDVSYSSTAERPAYSGTIGSATTFSYGMGVGVSYLFDNLVSIDLSFVYMRGGAVTVPYAEGSVVVNGSLYYDEHHLETISQGVVLLQLGLGTL